MKKIYIRRLWLKHINIQLYVAKKINKIEAEIYILNKIAQRIYHNVRRLT